MQDYEEELKKILQTITPNVDTYYGEFSSLNDIKIDHNKMPAIFVDFLGENPINSYQQKLTFSLYLVAASFSKNEKTRDEKRYSIYSLIQDVNKALHLKPILESEPIVLKPSKKIGSRLKNAFIKRSNQVKMVKEHAEKSPIPHIIAGDFNDTPISYTVKTISRDMNNCFRKKGSGFGITYNGAFPNFQIDYIFTSSEFEVKNYLIINKKLSDHYPVRADLELK